ncbi:MAG: hypothetical protein HYX63_05885 [Gammaproteobacteria bacterium]|nr:hypothetical protein [Gammaproteobacteria bacterium]
MNGDEAECARLAGIADAAGYRVIVVTAREALQRLAPPPRTVLVIDSDIDEKADYSLGLIDALHERGVYLPTLVTIPPFGITDAVNAIRRNATDILEQPLASSRFLHSIDAALQKKHRPAV